MSFLYNEILKYHEQTSIKVKSLKTESEFADELVNNERVRDDFLQDYVDEIIDTLGAKEIVRKYSEILLNEMYERCDAGEEQILIEECSSQFPFILSRFNVRVPKK